MLWVRARETQGLSQIRKKTHLSSQKNGSFCSVKCKCVATKTPPPFISQYLKQNETHISLQRFDNQTISLTVDGVLNPIELVIGSSLMNLSINNRSLFPKM